MDRLGLSVTIVLAGIPTVLAAQERSTVDLEGTSISYVEVGEGEPLVMLHGFGETGATWAPVVEDFAATYRVLVPDLPGHGFSSALEGDFTFANAAADIAQFMDALGISNARAIGFSAGGIVLLHLATADEDRLSAMVLIGAGPYIPTEARDYMRSMDVESIPMGALQSGELAQPDTARTRALLRQFVGLAEDSDDPNFTPPLLRTITARSLIVVGDSDDFFPTGLVQEMHEAIPESRLMILPNHPHLPFPADEVGRRFFVDRVLGFLEGGG